MFGAQFRVSRLFFLGGQPLDLLEPAGFELILALLFRDGDGGREVAVLIRCVEAASEVSPFRVARGGGSSTGIGRRSISLDRGSLPGPGHGGDGHGAAAASGGAGETRGFDAQARGRERQRHGERGHGEPGMHGRRGRERCDASVTDIRAKSASGSTTGGSQWAPSTSPPTRHPDVSAHSCAFVSVPPWRHPTRPRGS